MRSKPIFIYLIAGIAVLVMALCFFLMENRTYKVENRKLLLQNDSLMSVNILLNEGIDSLSKTASAHKLRDN